MANVLPANDFQLFAKHQDNIMASLTRRLEAARAANNSHLIELLEQEKQQIAVKIEHGKVVPNPKAAPSKTKSGAHWFKALTQSIAQAFSSELQVSQLVNGTDIWWYAFDPQTGRCVYADSEAELRLWIKQNYQGK